MIFRRLFISISIVLGFFGGVLACALPPDIIHEYRLEVIPGKNLEIHYSLSAWGNLEKEIQKEIAALGGVTPYLERALPEVTHIEIDRIPISLEYLTGGLVYHTGSDEGLYSITQATLVEGIYTTNIPSDTLEHATVELRFEKTHFRDITPLIHPYLFSNIQKDGKEGSYTIGDDGEQYFTYTHLGKTYRIRNVLEESEIENRFTLFLLPPREESGVGRASGVPVSPPTTPGSSLTSLFSEVKNTLEIFFYERTDPYIRALGLLIAVVLGMAHGLLPGHSKSLIATFIVSQKKVSLGEILVLIGSSAFSHTFFLFVLATLVLFLQKGLSHMAGYILTLSAIGYIAFGIFFVQRGRKMIHHSESHFGKKDCHCQGILQSSSRRSIMTSGILAGMNPCIDALALFLLALSIGDALYGLLMMVAFSLGLGLMLGILAFFIRSGKSLLSRHSERTSERFAAYTTFYSGIFIILLGSYTLIK